MSKIILLEHPIKVEVSAEFPNAVFINGVAFNLAVFEFLANPLPCLSIMMNNGTMTQIIQLQELHTFLTEYAKLDEESWLHSDLENCIMTQAKRLPILKPLEAYLPMPPPQEEPFEESERRCWKCGKRVYGETSPGHKFVKIHQCDPKTEEPS